MADIQHEPGPRRRAARHRAAALTRLQTLLDLVEAALRRVEPAPAWSAQETVARALEPVMPAFIAGCLRPERR